MANLVRKKLALNRKERRGEKNDRKILSKALYKIEENKD
jgi:hypothetical protein